MNLIPNPLTALANKAGGSITYTEALTKIVSLRTVSRIGIAGFVFAQQQETALEMETSKTQHFSQQGVALNDHTINHPIRCTVSGLVSEIRIDQSEFKKISNIIQVSAGAVSAFLPKLTTVSKSIISNLTGAKGQGGGAIATATYDSFFSAYDFALSALQLLTQQGRALAFFDALRISRTLVSVQLQGRFVSNMMVMKIDSNANEEGVQQSTITVELEEWRDVASITSEMIPSSFSAGIRNAVSGIKNQGALLGTNVPEKEAQAQRLLQQFGFNKLNGATRVIKK